jgi:thiol-disulfide isomerase/thioredoxin
MKKNVTLLVGGIALSLLSYSLLMAQSPSYPAGGYSSNTPYPSSSFPSQTTTSSLQTSNSSQNLYAVNHINWLRNYSDAVALSQSTSKPIAILFTGTGWCPACMKLERTVLNNPEFAQAVAQRFVFLKAEFPDYSESAVMASPYKPLLDRYGVNAFPTIVVVNTNGQMLYTVNYREGGPQAYAQELLQKLTQSGPMNPPSYNQF